MILDNLEENKTAEQIIEKLIRRFSRALKRRVNIIANLTGWRIYDKDTAGGR